MAHPAKPIVTPQRDPPPLPTIGLADPRDLGLLESLSDVALEMHRSLSLGDVLRVATERARQLIGAWEASTTQTAEDGLGAESTVEATADGRAARRLDHAVHGGGGPAAEVCRTNRALRLAWTAGPNRRAAAPAPSDPDGLGAWLGAPLIGTNGENLGLIQIAGTLHGGEFTAGDEAVLVQLARMASVAIENARLYRAAVDARGQLAWAAGVERVRVAELRAVINAMGEAVLVCDAAGRVSLVNPAAETLFRGRPVVTYEDLLGRFEKAGDEAVDPIVEPLERPLVDAPGRWIELRVYPVPGAVERGSREDEPGGLIAVMRDVTAARHARAQREAFLGILSHELRTPITTIYAGSKVLARDEPIDTPTGRELAADISAEAERLFRLVEDLLVMTRAERGVLQLASEPVLLQRVVTAAIRLEQAHWPTTEIRSTGPSDLPAVAGDATYVEQVLRNLVTNAAKYSPSGSRVEVRLEPAEDEVICRVLDRGPGFGSAEADDLFDLFYRSPATAAQAAGAGIGLFVCRRLVRAMGGRIWANPRPDGGAEFGFALGRYQGEED